MGSRGSGRYAATEPIRRRYVCCPTACYARPTGHHVGWSNGSLRVRFSGGRDEARFGGVRCRVLQPLPQPQAFVSSRRARYDGANIDITLEGVPRSTFTIPRDTLLEGGTGLIQRIENRVSGIPALLDHARADLTAAQQTIFDDLVRPEGIEPSACGLKDRCSLAPRREPLTTELRARAMDVCATRRCYEHNILSVPTPHARHRCARRQPQGVSTILSASRRSYTA
jgi:hypothetical protein